MIFLLLLLAQLAMYRTFPGTNIDLPDPAATPGVTMPISTEQVCRTRWGKDVRHVTLAMKRHVCALYGQLDCPGPRYEIDHLIPRELGGADADSNLWPQPILQARQKDKLENYLHKSVCRGVILLPAAQQSIRTNWWMAYQKMVVAP